MSPRLSVVLCTHDPRSDYISRALMSLRAQSLSTSWWELILVDNASTNAVAKQVNLSWHPYGRIVREDKLGLTSARLCGIGAAQSPLIVFIDDDNVFAPDYLEISLEIAGKWPVLGAWGGAVIGEFETPPPLWAKPYIGYLALREPTRAQWSNSNTITESLPCGAGMCVRHSVATRWADLVRADPVRLGLGRIGKGLGAAEDGDLAFTACDLGLGTGVFPQLRLQHLIPAHRLSLEYFERLVEEMSRAEVILRSLRHPISPCQPASVAARLYAFYSHWRMPPSVRILLRASDRGYRAGMATVQLAATATRIRADAVNSHVCQ